METGEQQRFVVTVRKRTDHDGRMRWEIVERLTAQSLRDAVEATFNVLVGAPEWSATIMRRR